ncbi:hypothetical protein [Pseudomonas gessardii]|uniref:hypothetical protein n=1 Tax=Pseudomonas gessardii TaxID=78544 RepID=UPI001474A75F|nr:hypothetical protein [Pseudomonas gessardii]NNA69477.1 hypothetical protein [Pseudomonas gessardii]
MCEECKKQIAALIAENERMSTNCLGVKLDVFEIVCAERDQLKAENERLSTENSEIESAAITYIEDMQEAQRENARLTELFTVGMTLDGNLRVYGDWQSVRKAQEILAERDQLRAEIAGLKTGYEAYERVNAELKAEVEGLRGAGAGALRFVAFAFDEGVEGAELAGRAIEDAIGAKS